MDTGAAEAIDGAGHANYVSGLASSSDGRSVASIGWDDTLRTVDASARTFSGVAQQTNGQPRDVVALGSHTVVATHKGLEVFSGGKEASFLETKYAPACAAGHGSTLVTGGDDAALHIHNLSSSGTLTHKLDIAQSGPLPSTLAFSPDGTLLAAGFANGKILVFDAMASGAWPVANSRWSAHTARVTGIAWRRDGRFAASGALDTAVFVWSVNNPGKRVSAPKAHKEGVNGVCWEGEQRVVSVGMDAAVKVWDVEGLA